MYNLYNSRQGLTTHCIAITISGSAYIRYKGMVGMVDFADGPVPFRVKLLPREDETWWE